MSFFANGRWKDAVLYSGRAAYTLNICSRIGGKHAKNQTAGNYEWYQMVPEDFKKRYGIKENFVGALRDKKPTSDLCFCL